MYNALTPVVSPLAAATTLANLEMSLLICDASRTNSPPFELPPCLAFNCSTEFGGGGVVEAAAAACERASIDKRAAGRIAPLPMLGRCSFGLKAFEMVIAITYATSLPDESEADLVSAQRQLAHFTHPMAIDSDGIGDLHFFFRVPESWRLLETGVDVVTGDGSLPRGDGVKLLRDVDDKSTEPKGKLLG